ncbi:DUF2628 domain-containing protein [Hutsoniella sourekii]
MITVADAMGNMKSIKLGISWTTLFFGFWVPLFRRDWKWFFLMIIINIILGEISHGFYDDSASRLLGNLANILWALYYNRLYAKDLYKDGYRGVTPEANWALEEYIA